MDIGHWIKSTGEDDNMIYEYWFSKITGISSQKKQKLREYLGSGKAIYNIEETKLNLMENLSPKEKMLLKNAKKEIDLEESFRKLEAEKILFVPYFDDTYPERLRNISSKPYALYVKGRLPEENKLSVAIVGARMCTTYGEMLSIEYAKELAGVGVQIISGMARGIDGAAQRGALKVGGETFAVLGSGPDICYPKEHMGLYRDIQEQGGIISEYVPDTPPLPMHFPARNRIISGLSDVILVMEAKEKSGSLITADMALEQGKDVYALPGPVTSTLSTGCHLLISQGAGILVSPSELKKELNLQIRKFEQKADKSKKELESPENIVYSCLDLYPKGVELLIQETGLEPRKILSDLISLELEGKVKEISKNHYVRIT